MSTKSRRRTLSHLEEENFLNEINSNKSLNNDVYIPHKVQKLENISEIVKPESSELTSAGINDNAQMIRDFCKIKCIGRAHDMFQWEAIRNLSRNIYHNTSYKLMPERSMISNRTYHPIGTTENRREILLSLSSMLTDAENQRKQEVEACELFTKCRSHKVRSRNTYEYIDLESSKVINFADYERRYMQYITETTLNRQQNYSLRLQSLSVSFLLSIQHPENKENIFIQSLSDSSVNSTTRKTINKCKLTTNVLASHEDIIGARNKSNSNRRENLSPETARKLLIEKVETVMSPQPEGSHIQSVSSSPAVLNSSLLISENSTRNDPGESLRRASPIRGIDLIPFNDKFSSDFGDTSSLLTSCVLATGLNDVRRSSLSPSAARLVGKEFISEENVIDRSTTISAGILNGAVTTTSIDVLSNSQAETIKDPKVSSESHSSLNADSIVAKQDFIEIVSKSDEKIGSLEPTVVAIRTDICEIHLVEIPTESLITIEIPVESELCMASELNSMIVTSPSRRFFGRKSKGNIVNRGLEILNGSSSELEAFELESFVSGVLLAKSMEARSPHFISPDRNLLASLYSPSKLSQPKFSPAKTISEVEIVSNSLSNHGVAYKNVEELHNSELREIDEEEGERRASQCMKDRFAAARWQYLWEMVSAQAANKAINEARKKKKN